MTIATLDLPQVDLLYFLYYGAKSREQRATEKETSAIGLMLRLFFHNTATIDSQLTAQVLFNDFYRDESLRMIFMIRKQLKNVLMYQGSLISSRYSIEEEVSEAALGLSRRPHFILTNRTAHAMTKIIRF